MAELKFLKSKGLIKEECTEFIITGDFGKIKLTELLKEYKIEQLRLHGVSCGFCGDREFRTTKNYKPAKKCCECSRVRIL